MPFQESASPASLLTLAEGRARLRISHPTLAKLIDAGRLPVVRIGRRVLISPGALEAFIAQAQREGAAR